MASFLSKDGLKKLISSLKKDTFATKQELADVNERLSALEIVISNNDK